MCEKVKKKKKKKKKKKITWNNRKFYEKILGKPMTSWIDVPNKQ